MNSDKKREDRILAGRYHLIELVGSGAMGQVYRAEDKVLGGVTVAVKFLSHTLLNDKMRQRFEREATISALLGEKSLHIVKVRDYGVDENDVPFYVMEFLVGQSLSDIIKFQPLELKRFLRLTRQICVGLEAAHTGIMLHGELCQVVHRDIKPSNILVTKEPTLGELIKILDFGIARLVQANATQTHSFMGTLAYCSPEQMEGKKLDNRSDIYSLGVMMYEMLTLEMPILPDSSSFGAWYKAHHEYEPRPFDPRLNIPSELKNIIMRCMAKSREDRPQTVGEIIQVIDNIEKSLQESATHDRTYFSGHPTVVADVNKDVVKGDDTPTIAIPTSRQKNRIDTSPTEVATQVSASTTISKLTWPKNKPLQKIVFPRIVTTETETFASLWVMLDKQDIINRLISVRYNQFLFLHTPHPMILWITVIYNPTHGPRWLPCYLDLKSESSRQVVSLLSDTGSYRILFFAIEEPDRCQHSMMSTIAANQCKIMKEWLKMTATMKTSGDPAVSKKRLKEEFERLKPKILAKLAESYK